MLFQVLKVVSQWILISSPVIWTNLPFRVIHSKKKKIYSAKFCAEHWVFSDGQKGYDLCPLGAYSLGRETNVMAISHNYMKKISQCNGNVQNFKLEPEKPF